MTDCVTPMKQTGLDSRMANALYLLTELRRRGYTVARQDDGLTISPRSRLTEGERDELKEYKPELMVLLFEGQ